MRERKAKLLATSLKPSHSHTLALSSLLGGMLIALTAARWIVPAEATAEGETVWIAGLWFAAGIVISVLWWKRPLSPRWDFGDLAVGLLIGGHVLSGLIVVFSVGDRRAAWNLIWEWLSLGVFWFAWRMALRSAELRRIVVPVCMAAAVTLSAWGLWQYFVWYPQMQAKYGPLFEQLRQLEAAGQDASAIKRQLIEAGIPTEGSPLLLFKNRLMQSHEPFGPFALANTFGGLLAAWLMLGLGVGLFGDASQKRSPTIYLWLLPILVCLYLTNSRTAWAGTVVGLTIGGLMLINPRLRSPMLRHWLFPAASLLFSLIGIAGLWLITQDQHVIPGPLKSLSYRAEYWIGTWRLLAMMPWLGAGLGQFRDRYLAFKLPESSEEIADPHNLLLDVWANGGPIGLAGLLGLIAVMWQSLWRTSREPVAPQSPSSATAGPLSRMSWIVPGLAAFVLVIAAQLCSQGWDDLVDRLMIFAGVWFVVAWLLPQRFANCGEQSVAGLVAAAVLTVHLLGAGGIAMPAVTQLGLLLIAWGITPAREDSAAAASRSLFPWPALACVTSLLLLAGCFLTSWRPVSARKHWIAAGDFQWMAKRNVDQAEQDYRRAERADPWSSEPWQRLGELEFSLALASPGGLERPRLDAAVHSFEEAIRRAPLRPALQLELAEMFTQAARRSRQEADWNSAVEVYRSVLPRHPTNVRLLADMADALSHTGSADEAAAMARRALAQDELNRSRGHTDRYLPESTRRNLAALESRL